MRSVTIALVFTLALAAAASARQAQGPTRLANGRLVYSVYDDESVDGYADLVVSDPNGTRKKVLPLPPEAEGSGVYTDADWSPDGTKIAATLIVGNRYTGHSSEIFILNADGSRARHAIPGAWANRSRPAWSPDGTKLLFVQGDHEIHVVGADGTGQRLLTSGSDPAWSPDGSKIVFSKTLGADDTDLYVMNADGSGATQLTSGTLQDRAPDWSPDGRLIVFERGQPAFSSVYVVAPDGSGLRRLTRTRYDYGPSWSPDGTKIAFSRSSDLWIMSRDGSHAHNLTRTKSLSQDEGAQDWQPVHVVDGQIHGTLFDDYLIGGSESNVIDGQGGNDVIAGGRGHDTLVGGPGNDTFYAQDRQRDAIDGGDGLDTAFVDKRFDRVSGVERKYSKGG